MNTKYKTLEFRITATTSQDNLKETMDDAFDRFPKYLHYALGENYTQSTDFKPTEKLDCPYCESMQLAFITSIYYSQNKSRRIVLAKCTHCGKTFDILQEIEHSN